VCSSVAKGPGDRALRFPGGVTKLRIAGLLLIAGAAITFTLHLLEVPEDLYRWLYHHLLSGLDVPKDPSEGTVTAVRDVSLVGGVLELVIGVGLLVADRLRAD
jgi:hypothetical protein